MAGNHISDEEIEGRLKAYFQAEAEEFRAPADLWARLAPRLERPGGERRRAGAWWRLIGAGRWGPIPGTAALGALLLLVMVGAWLFMVGPGVPRLSQEPAVAPMPFPYPTPMLRPAPTPTPPPKYAPSAEPPAPSAKEREAAAGGTDGLALVGQAWAVERMVIRNGTLSLVVEDAARTIERAAQLAKDMGGYVVSSRMWQDGKNMAGDITIRVPAELFSDAMRALKAMAVEVVTEDATSQDVTEEYVDLSSRLRTLEATEEQLLKIMESATKVEDVLAVQRELTRVRGEIENTRGRMQYLERSSATSLIRVTLREVGLDIRIRPSTIVAKVGEKIRLSAQVAGGFPPYAYYWDLGDGTTSAEEAPEHAYSHVGKFDLRLTITDDRGNITTEVKRELITIAPMEAGFEASRTEVGVGEEIWFNSGVAGGFPPYAYQWDLGDGTTSTERHPRHAYSKAGRYTISLTISDDQDNTASQTEKKLITVTAPLPWSVGKQAGAALRALSSVGRWLITGLIWTAVFLPLWGLLIGVVIVVGILRRRRT